MKTVENGKLSHRKPTPVSVRIMENQLETEQKLSSLIFIRFLFCLW